MFKDTERGGGEGERGREKTRMETETRVNETKGKINLHVRKSEAHMLQIYSEYTNTETSTRQTILFFF